MKPLHLSHFKKVDMKIYELALKFELEPLIKTDNFFERLCRTIIGQQLSGKVARVIFARFADLFPKNKIEPHAVLELTDTKIRSVGMSNSKVAFIKDLAKKVIDGEVDLERVDEFSDAEIIEQLTKVYGIGPWSAEMFLIFSLARPDVFSSGDLGLLRAIEKLYGLKNPSREKLEKISEKWSPYRSFASRLLWKSLDNE